LCSRRACQDPEVFEEDAESNRPKWKIFSTDGSPISRLTLGRLVGGAGKAERDGIAVTGAELGEHKGSRPRRRPMVSVSTATEATPA